MQVADETKKVLGDRFVYRGRIYEVKSLADWTEGTDLPYNKYYALKVETT